MGKNKAPSFQFYASDFLIDTAEMEAESVGAYIRLLCNQWVNGDVPKEQKKLARVAGVDENKFAEIWKEIEEKFQEKNGRLVNKKLEKIRKTREEFVKNAAKAGKNGALKRWGNNSEPHSEPHSEPNSENMPFQSSSSSSSSSSSLSSSSLKQTTPKKAPSAFMENLKKVYLDFYGDLSGTPYFWQGKDAKALGGLVAKLKKSIQEKSGNVPGAEEVEAGFKHLLQNLPPWFLEKNPELSTINGNYNSIVNQIIQGKNGNNKAAKSIIAEINARNA